MEQTETWTTELVNAVCGMWRHMESSSPHYGVDFCFVDITERRVEFALRGDAIGQRGYVFYAKLHDSGEAEIVFSRLHSEAVDSTPIVDDFDREIISAFAATIPNWTMRCKSVAESGASPGGPMLLH